jgi:polyphosphate kinase 2
MASMHCSLPDFADFDLDDPKLPRSIKDAALGSDSYPYGEKLDKKIYEAELEALQIELIKLLAWQGATGARSILLFEGRDASGKGGAIKAIRNNLNPRHARVVALAKPSDREAGQWYFQRYAAELPAAGEMVLFDRSWYNRGVVEPVMGFCTPDETERFLAEAPDFERMLVRDGIRLFKFWLTIGREMQLLRFHERRHDPLKAWKISPVDLAAAAKWDDFTRARDRMFAATHTDHAPWILVEANDKRRAHLNLIRHVLLNVDYSGRDLGAIGSVDPKILGIGPSAIEGEG